MSNNKNFIFVIIIISLISGSLAGALAGFSVGSSRFEKYNFDQKSSDEQEGLNAEKIVKIEEESAVVTAVESASPAVVSIIVTKDLPIIERYYSDPFGHNDMFGDFFGDFFGFPQYRQKGTQKQEVGGGTGFIVSADGYIITNKHVVYDKEAEYTVLLNDEAKYSATVLDLDPTIDLAVLKIEARNEQGEIIKLPFVELGDSSILKAGQTVIAIGNALGEFRNTVSVGVISGLSRSITAAGGGYGLKEMFGLIQTDASINPGNSGGPLLNLAGQVIGINTAMAQGAENIGFAITINEVKNTIESVKKHGRIIRPWLGVRYVIINEEIKEANKLAVDYGAIVIRGDNRTDLAVIPGSPADKAGLQENDIILEIEGNKISADNPLIVVIGKYQPNDEVELKILRQGKEEKIKVILEEME